MSLLPHLRAHSLAQPAAAACTITGGGSTRTPARRVNRASRLLDYPAVAARAAGAFPAEPDLRLRHSAAVVQGTRALRRQDARNRNGGRHVTLTGSTSITYGAARSPLQRRPTSQPLSGLRPRDAAPSAVQPMRKSPVARRQAGMWSLGVHRCAVLDRPLSGGVFQAVGATPSRHLQAGTHPPSAALHIIPHRPHAGGWNGRSAPQTSRLATAGNRAALNPSGNGAGVLQNGQGTHLGPHWLALAYPDSVLSPCNLWPGLRASAAFSG